MPAAKDRALATPRELLDATTEPELVNVPARSAVAIDGHGEPKGDAFRRSLEALYGIAYALKVARKRERRRPFAIGPLEGRWWWDRPVPAAPPPRAWRWRLRIGVPSDVTLAELRRGIASVREKEGGKLEASAEAVRVRLERVPRQRVGRILHVGPYNKETESLEAIRATVERSGRRCSGPHMEVYLSDPRRVTPSRLRTVLLRELVPPPSRDERGT